MIITVIAFIILLGVLVLIHEWGHFFTARRFGVRVEEFAFGFPPRIASIVRGGTRYAFNLLPLGGYVKIYGEGGEGSTNPESFSSRPLYQRFIIIVAGVAMNFLLAWVLFSIGHGVGLPTIISDEETDPRAKVTIIGVAPGSPAEQSGLHFGDTIQKLVFRGEQFSVQSVETVREFVASHAGEEIDLVVKRGNTELEIAIVPRSDPPPGEGAVGIAMAKIGVVRAPWWRAPWDGLKTTASAVVAIAQGLARAGRDLVVEKQVSADISGPVGIFVFANETRQLGLIYLLELAGVLSINLAFLNILPIPALDGGRILFLFIEKARGGVRVNQKIEQLVHTMGFVLLLTLMAAITYRDIVRIF